MSAPLPAQRPAAGEPAETAPTPARRAAGGWISLRATLLAFLLAPATAYWSIDQGVDVIFSLMVPPTVMTLIIAAANMIVRRIAPKVALSEGELIIFYGMHTVIGAMCAEWMMVINPYIHSYALFRSGNTRFDTYILPYAHPWFFVQAKDADKYIDFRNGGFSFAYFLTRLPLWWKFIGAWTTLVTFVCTAMLCVNSLMRDEWTNREKLSFPIIQLPMAIVQAGAGKSQVWRSRFFVIPFVVMFAIDMINGFHFIYPSLPLINVRFIADLHTFTSGPPWNAIGWTPVGIFPYMCVIGFFMPTDLLFSCIFFFFFRKAEQVITYAIGFTESAGVFGGGGLVPSAPYFSEQSWGAFLALFVTAAWVARGYLGEVWGEIVRGGSPDGQSVPHRVAFVGLLLSLGGVAGIGLIVGIPLWMVAFATLLFLAFSIALTRMRAQIGAPSHEMAFMGPNQMLVDFVGTQALPHAGVSRMVTMFHFFNRIHRTHPMPHQLEAMKMGDSARLNQRALFIAIIMATVGGSVLGHCLNIYRGYHFGAQHEGGDTAGVVATLLEKHQPPNPTAILFVVLGFAAVLALDFIRFRVPAFPLHPAGYALAMNFGLDYFWFGLIIVWIIKLFVERYYGLGGHSKLHQVALGIITAEFCAEAIWATYSMINHTATYSISINGRLGWDQ
ncbi:MAG TPA: DUF6785 family protein [Chthonomonadaceae bacterium]|nr:DUF6785 family protein [Chthonomonadaceae bacterium]